MEKDIQHADEKPDLIKELVCKIKGKIPLILAYGFSQTLLEEDRVYVSSRYTLSIVVKKKILKFITYKVADPILKIFKEEEFGKEIKIEIIADIKQCPFSKIIGEEIAEHNQNHPDLPIQVRHFIS